MKLDQLQNDFIAAIFNEDRERAETYVVGDDRLDASQRLGIYRGSVHGILTQSLSDTFPICKALLGEKFFDKMCDRFIDKYPPTTPFFSQYGNKLASFLDSFEPVKEIPYISDIALFEWKRHELWQQISNEPFDFSQIASLSEAQQEKLIFNLSPSLSLFNSEYRIDLIWFAHQENSDLQLEEIDINNEINLLMWKGNDSIKIANFESKESTNLETRSEKNVKTNFSNKEYWDFLKAISDKLTITELALQFGEKFPELLKQSILDGRIESFTCE